MTLLASPLESIESAVIWLLVVFSVATWGLALLKAVQFGRLKAQDRKFHKRFWAASSLDSAAELSETQPGAAARVALRVNAKAAKGGSWAEYTHYSTSWSSVVLSHGVTRARCPQKKKPRHPRGRGFQPSGLVGSWCAQDLDAGVAAAAGTWVLGGLLAVPGGEWAPAASAGLAAGGV